MRQPAHQSGNRPDPSDAPTQLRLSTQDAGHSAVKIAAGAVCIANQRVQISRRLSVQIGLPGFDQIPQIREEIRGLPNQVRERRDDLMFARRARLDPVQAVPPPLQTDCPDHRLAHHLGRLGDLVIGSQQDEQCGLDLRLGEQHRQVALPVVPLDEASATLDEAIGLGCSQTGHVPKIARRIGSSRPGRSRRRSA